MRKERKKWMMSQKMFDCDDIPMEAWGYLGEGNRHLTRLFNAKLESERMPEECSGSVLVLIFKNTSDVQRGCNREIKLMIHTMMLHERVVKARLLREFLF